MSLAPIDVTSVAVCVATGDEHARRRGNHRDRAVISDSALSLPLQIVTFPRYHTRANPSIEFLQIASMLELDRAR